MSTPRKASGGKRPAKRAQGARKARSARSKDVAAECAAGRHPKDRRKVFGWGAMCEACGSRVG